MKRLLFFAFFVVLASNLLHADVSKDSFDYLKYKELALKELLLEQQALNDQLKDGSLPEMYKSIGIDNYAPQNLDGLIRCFQSESTADGFKKMMDGLVNLDYSLFSKPTEPSCAGSQKDIIETSSLLFQSKRLVTEYDSGIEIPDQIDIHTKKQLVFDSVVSALLQLYRAKVTPSASLYEERVSNTVLFLAQRRLNPYFAFIDFGYLKYRYGSHAELVPYLLESRLTDDDRIGLLVLAQCVKDNTPLGPVASYAAQGDSPPDSLLDAMPCLSVAIPQTISASTEISPVLNFKRLGLAIMGQNLLLFRPYQDIPSVAREVMKGATHEDRLAAKQQIYDLNDFVNVHVSGLRKGLSSFSNFKGSAGLPRVKKLVLTDVLLYKYRQENREKIRSAAKWKAANDLLEYIGGAGKTCVEGQVKGAVIGYAVGYGLGVATKVPYVRYPAMVLSAGLVIYSVKDIGEQVAELSFHYKEISSNRQVAAKACDTVANLWQMGGLYKGGLDGAKALSQWISKAKQQGKLKNGKVPDDAAVKPPEGGSVVHSSAQVETPGQALYTKIWEGIKSKVERENQYYAEFKKALNDYIKAKFKPKAAKGKGSGSPPKPVEAEPPSLDGLTAAARTAEKNGDDLAKKTAMEAKNDPERKELNKQAQSDDSSVSRGAKVRLDELDDEAIFKFLTEEGLVDRVLVLQNADGRRFVYIPEKPGVLEVPADVAAKFKKLVELSKDAGVELKVQTKNNHQLVSLDDFVSEFNSGLTSNDQLRILQDFFNPSGNLGLGPKTKALSSAAKKQLYFKLTDSLPESERFVFQELFAEMFDLRTYAPVPNGVKSALLLRKERYIKNQFSDDQADFALKLILALDPEVPKGLDVFDPSHVALLSVTGGVKLQKADLLRAQSKYNQKGDKAAQKLAKEQLAEAERIERQYDEDLVARLAEFERPKGSRSESDPLLSKEEFEFIFSKYWNGGDRHLAFAEAFNLRWHVELLKALKQLEPSGQAFPGLGRITQVKTEHLGSGTFRDALVVFVFVEGRSKPVKLVAKVGENSQAEVNLLNQWAEIGRAPKSFGIIGPEENSVLLQQFVDVVLFDKQLLSENKEALAKEAAELAADLAGLSYDPNAKTLTIVHDFYANIGKSEGREIIFDADPRATEPLSLKEYLIFMLNVGEHHLGPEGNKAFLKAWIAKMGKKVGEAEIRTALQQIQTEFPTTMGTSAFGISIYNLMKDGVIQDGFWVHDDILPFVYEQKDARPFIEHLHEAIDSYLKVPVLASKT